MRKIVVYLLLFLMIPSCGWRRSGTITPDVWSGHTTNHIGALFLSADDVADGHDVQTDVTSLSRFSAFWMAQVINSRQPEVWAIMQATQGYKLYGYYVSGFTTMDTTSPSYLSLTEAETHPTWFLTDGTDRLRWSDDPNSEFYERYFLDVGNTDFQTWAASEWLEILQDAGQRHLVMDNVLLDVWSFWKTRTYPNWTYAGREVEWRTDFIQYLSVVKAALNADNRYLIVNCTEDYGLSPSDSKWVALRAAYDGMADEQCLGSPNTLWDGSQWEYSLQNHEQIASENKWDWWLYDPNDTPAVAQQQFLYVYGSFMLCRTPFSIFVDGDNVEHDEYDYSLGKATGVRYQTNGVWLRSFEGGWVAVNPTEGAVVVTEAVTLQPSTGILVVE